MPNSRKETKPRPIPRAVTAAYLERAALYYLERFAASSAHLESVLRRKIMRRCKLRKESPEAFYPLIAPLIERYVASGLLDDVRYAQAKVATLRRKGNSGRMIGAKLMQKGVKREVIADRLAADETSELEAARELVRRKKLLTRDYEKALCVLGRAGFSYAISKRALKDE